MRIPHTRVRCPNKLVVLGCLRHFSLRPAVRSMGEASSQNTGLAFVGACVPHTHRFFQSDLSIAKPEGVSALMYNAQTVIYEDELRQLEEICERLLRDSMAKSVFLVDKVGQLVAEHGQTQNIDTTSLASLIAGATAATGGLANLLGEEEFPTHYHQGARDSLYIALIGEQWILTVIFDERSTEGLVRLRVKRAGGDLERVFDAMNARSSQDKERTNGLFAEITDEDIEDLFSDTF